MSEQLHHDIEQTITKDVYDIAETGRKGVVVWLENGEYLRVERGSEYLGILWPSTLQPTQLLAEMAQLFDVSDGVPFLQAFVVSGHEMEDAKGRQDTQVLVEKITQDDGQVSMMRFDAEELVVAWSRAGNLEDENGVVCHECSVVIAEGGEGLVSELIMLTATEGVAQRASELVAVALENI